MAIWLTEASTCTTGLPVGLDVTPKAHHERYKHQTKDVEKTQVKKDLNTILILTNKTD